MPKCRFLWNDISKVQDSCGSKDNDYHRRPCYVREAVKYGKECATIADLKEEEI
ncbi:MAG: hypothetical protein K0R78_1500 [Pelosinus sp.]|jgi:hypothetical protein|nr:hypothetical protein [Pelosinus sp.]